MPSTSSHELRREATILLRRLSKSRGYVMKSERDGTWQVYTAKNRYGRPVATTADEIIQLLRREGEIVERPGGGFAPAIKVHALPLMAEILEGAGASGPVLRNEAEWALGWLRSRRDADGNPMIRDEQFAAAETLRGDYTMACLEPRVTQTWDQPISSRQCRGAGTCGGGVSEKALLAKKRLFEALNVVGPELAGILLEICCLTAGIEQAERSLGLPERSGRPILQLALTRLARHYGLLPQSEVHIRKAVRHWGLEGYRPDL